MTYVRESTIELPWRPYGIAYNSTFSQETRLAISSFELKDVNIIKTYKLIGSTASEEKQFEVPFPQTRIMFNPLGSTESSDLLLSCGDQIRLLNVSPTGISLAKEIAINATNDPITCIDWNSFQDNLVIAGSTDTTATAIDINTGDILTQLIAHDNPLHDICFCGGPSTFITAGFDGSLRFFDLRDVQSSYIYYKTAMPILRAVVNPLEPNKIAVFAKGSQAVTIVDTRRPCVPFAFGAKHKTQVTAAAWSKTSEGLLFSTDDKGFLRTAVISEASADNEVEGGAYNSEVPIESFAVSGPYIAIATQRSIQIVKNNAPTIMSIPSSSAASDFLMNL